jgi:hypothetical protein
MVKGSHQTPEHIRKRVEAMRGKPSKLKGRKRPPFSAEWIKKQSESHKGQKAWNKGLKLSEKHIENLSKGHIGINTGKDNGRWIEDRNLVLENSQKDTTEYRNWRLEVYRRDEFKCKINNNDCCGRIEAHHIMNWIDYPELRYEPNNGITLCHFHHPFGRQKEEEAVPMFSLLLRQENYYGSN